MSKHLQKFTLTDEKINRLGKDKHNLKNILKLQEEDISAAFHQQHHHHTPNFRSLSPKETMSVIPVIVAIARSGVGNPLATFAATTFITIKKKSGHSSASRAA